MFPETLLLRLDHESRARINVCARQCGAAAANRDFAGTVGPSEEIKIDLGLVQIDILQGDRISPVIIGDDRVIADPGNTDIRQ